MIYTKFSDQLPDVGRTILCGNHRSVFSRKFLDHWDWKSEKYCFLPITHWCYVDLPKPEESDEDD